LSINGDDDGEADDYDEVAAAAAEKDYDDDKPWKLYSAELLLMLTKRARLRLPHKSKDVVTRMIKSILTELREYKHPPASCSMSYVLQSMQSQADRSLPQTLTTTIVTGNGDGFSLTRYYASPKDFQLMPCGQSQQSSWTYCKWLKDMKGAEDTIFTLYDTVECHRRSDGRMLLFHGTILKSLVDMIDHGVRPIGGGAMGKGFYVSPDPHHGHLYARRKSEKG